MDFESKLSYLIRFKQMSLLAKLLSTGMWKHDQRGTGQGSEEDAQ